MHNYTITKNVNNQQLVLKLNRQGNPRDILWGITIFKLPPPPLNELWKTPLDFYYLIKVYFSRTL